MAKHSRSRGAHRPESDHDKMSKFSTGLKALINAPTARPSTVPAPSNITAVYRAIQKGAESKYVSQPCWLALSVSFVFSRWKFNLIHLFRLP